MQSSPTHPATTWWVWSMRSDEAVVLILSYMTAYRMLYRSADIQPEQTVLIHGTSGAVGTALAQLGKISGLTRYGTASTGKQDYVASMGVTPTDYKTEDFVARIMEETGGQGVNIVFDAIGVDNFIRSYSVLKPGGLLVEYGLYPAAARGHPGAPLHRSGPSVEGKIVLQVGE